MPSLVTPRPLYGYQILLRESNRPDSHTPWNPRISLVPDALVDSCRRAINFGVREMDAIRMFGPMAKAMVGNSCLLRLKQAMIIANCELESEANTTVEDL